MLDFKNGIQFLGLLLILLTCVICFNYACQDHKKEIVTETKIKTDTIVRYVYGTSKAQRVVNKIIRVRDTITLSDTFIVFRDQNLDLEVNHINSDTPIVNYRIKEVTIKDSIFIPATKPRYLGIGLIGNQFSIGPALSYSNNRCNYLLGYDVKNNVPSFGILVNFANIAKPAHLGE